MTLFSILNKSMHYGIYFSIFLSPFVPLNYMYLYLGFQLITVYHWYLFNGQCVLTLFQNTLDNTNTTLTGHIFQYFNLPLYTYDIIYHTSLLYSFYRLNIFQKVFKQIQQIFISLVQQIFVLIF